MLMAAAKCLSRRGSPPPAGAQQYPAQTIKIVSFVRVPAAAPHRCAPRDQNHHRTTLQDQLGQSLWSKTVPGAERPPRQRSVANSAKTAHSRRPTAGQIITPIMSQNVRFDAVESFELDRTIAVAGLPDRVCGDYPYKDSSRWSASSRSLGKIVFASPGFGATHSSCAELFNRSPRRHAARAAIGSLAEAISKSLPAITPSAVRPR